MKLIKLQDKFILVSAEEATVNDWVTDGSSKDGFKTAQSLNDKQFSLKEMKMIFAYGCQVGMNEILQIQSPHLMDKQNTDNLRDKFI